MTHARLAPEMLFLKVTNSRLMPFCFLTLTIGNPLRSVTGSSPSANAEEPACESTHTHGLWSGVPLHTALERHCCLDSTSYS